ncbi:unnamed protein product [Euphydryas editha]|uniref:Uncharacterized protein n=1 Tax=Euphydryas editha TaxID=104508 RepID=A0AAU9UXU4_EUPED|nr:unnamed protein product [Euphydryas editha]
MDKLVHRVKDWSGLSRKPATPELSRSQYSLVSTGELTAEALQVWLKLPKKIKYDPELESFQKCYEKEIALSIPDTPTFFPNWLSECDVKKNLLLKKSDSVGPDSIPLLDILTLILASVFNTFISGSFPSMSKDAEIGPCPKKKKKHSFVFN